MTAVPSTPRLGHEFTLYLLRNPEARERVAAKRLEVVEALSKFIAEGLDRMGGALLIPPLTFAQLLVATSDSIVLGSQLDDVDLYRPILEMYVSVIKLPGRMRRRSASRRVLDDDLARRVVERADERREGKAEGINHVHIQPLDAPFR